MNKFIVVQYATPPQREHVLNRIVASADSEMPFHIGRRHLFEIKQHKLIVYSAEAATSAFSRAEQVFKAREAFLLFDGCPVFEGQNPDAPWAERLFRHFRRGPTGQFFTSVMGDYGMVALKDGVLTAFGDFAGGSPVFLYQRDGMAAISNRQRLLHRVLNEGGRVELDPQALAWLMSQGNVFGTKSPFKGVELIAPGRFAKVRERAVTRGGFKRFYANDRRAPDLSPEQADEAVAALFRQAALIAELPFETLQMDLTGGMDSRATLAIALGSGLIDRVSSVKTMGPPGSPEIEAARAVAEPLGLPFEPVVAAPSSAPADIDKLWNRLRLNVTALDGTVMAGDGLPGVHTRNTLCLSGSAGELYRPHVKSRRTRVFTGLDDAKRGYTNYQLKMDSLGVLKGEVTEAHRRFFRTSVERMHEAGVPFEDMHFAFYTEGRMPWWNGYMMANVMGRRRLFPLANYSAAEIMFSVDPMQKQIDRLHFELMKAADVRLLSIPFLSNAWDPRLLQYAGSAPIALEPMKTKTADILQNRKPWLFELAESRWDQIFDYVLSDRNSVIFDALDRRKVERVAKDRNRLAAGTVRHILTLLSMAMLERDVGLPVKQGQPLPRKRSDVNGQAADSSPHPAMLTSRVLGQRAEPRR